MKTSAGPTWLGPRSPGTRQREQALLHLGVGPLCREMLTFSLINPGRRNTTEHEWAQSAEDSRGPQNVRKMCKAEFKAIVNLSGISEMESLVGLLI